VLWCKTLFFQKTVKFTSTKYSTTSRNCRIPARASGRSARPINSMALRVYSVWYDRDLPCSRVKSRDDPISNRRGDSELLYCFIVTKLDHLSSTCNANWLARRGCYAMDSQFNRRCTIAKTDIFAIVATLRCSKVYGEQMLCRTQHLTTVYGAASAISGWRHQCVGIECVCKLWQITDSCVFGDFLRPRAEHEQHDVLSKSKNILCRILITARRSYASAVLGVVILSVCLSVGPSVCHTRALWLIQRIYRRYFYTTWKGNPSSFLSPNSGWWATSSST